MRPDRPRIELSPRAVRDLHRIDTPARKRIRQALDELVAGAENADVRALAVDPEMHLELR